MKIDQWQLIKYVILNLKRSSRNTSVQKRAEQILSKFEYTDTHTHWQCLGKMWAPPCYPNQLNHRTSWRRKFEKKNLSICSILCSFSITYFMSKWMGRNRQVSMMSHSAHRIRRTCIQFNTIVLYFYPKYWFTMNGAK